MYTYSKGNPHLKPEHAIHLSFLMGIKKQQISLSNC
ncbi:hypothetical protein [Pedobacter cryoconitis]